MSKIEVRELSKDYGSNRGVFDISFSISKGEVYGFLGPNGAGKSTTIRHLMGFSKPDKGKTKILNEESFNNYDAFMENVGYLPGEIALPSGVTGYEFLMMMKEMKNMKDENRLKHLLNLFELNPYIETKRMSLGDKRKLAIVAAFMHDPEILILDEPTSGLDLRMQQVFVDFIKKEKERGKTILLSSHIFSEIDRTCDRIAIIKEGKLVSEFLANDLKHKQDKIYEIIFEKSEDKKKFIKSRNNQNWTVEDKNDCAVRVFINDFKINYLIAKLSKYSIADFKQHKETLEDYFMKYYKKDNGSEGDFNDRNK